VVHPYCGKMAGTAIATMSIFDYNCGPGAGCTEDFKVSSPLKFNVSLWGFKGKLTLRSSVKPAPGLVSMGDNLGN